ncbi:MAG: hypothetical protein ACLFSH_11795 [Phormidium sp.]
MNHQTSYLSGQSNRGDFLSRTVDLSAMSLISNYGCMRIYK